QVTARNAVPVRYAHTTRFDDFYRRRLWGRGTFFTRDDIEAKQPMETIDLLRGVPGVRVATLAAGVADQASMAFARCSGPDSKVSVWLDGNKMNLYANAKGSRGGGGSGSSGRAGGGQEQNSKSYSREMEDDVRIGPIQALMEISPLDIEAMEIYRGVSSIPGEFLDDSCAVIVMWSRHR
ncbi:MAG: TonB-dependent receptor plug domain-containing protein, partial [Gemmatimonadota bacterium]